MNPDTLEFCQEGAPFTVRKTTGYVWLVRSRLGEDVASCDDPDAAHAIEDALNNVAQASTPASLPAVPDGPGSGTLPQPAGQRPALRK